MLLKARKEIVKIKVRSYNMVVRILLSLLGHSHP